MKMKRKSQTYNIKMKLPLQLLLSISLLLGLVQGAAITFSARNERVSRRRQEIRKLNGIGDTDPSTMRRNKSTYKINGHKYFVKKEQHEKHQHHKQDANRTHSQRRQEEKEPKTKTYGSKNGQLKKYSRKPVLLDANKRRAFKEYHKNGRHLR